MAYVKTNWVNGETPINDTNLNHIENGVKDLETNLEDTEARLKGKTILWEDSDGILPANQTLGLNDNIYNYRFVIIEGQWGNKFIIPIIEENTYFNGGMNYVSGAGTGMMTTGINGTITNMGDSVNITYFSQLTHRSNSNHETLQTPRLYKIIGIL